MLIISIFKRLIRISPWVLFLPFLAIYLFIALNFQETGLIGDEKRYLYHAEMIVNGRYSPEPPNIEIWNAPGYPLFIAPLVGLFDNPISAIKIQNAITLYLSVVIMFLLLIRLVKREHAFWGAFVFATYFLVWKSLPYVLTEIFTIFLFVLILDAAEKTFRSTASRKQMLWLAFLICSLAMTKVLFGYVITVSVFLWGILYLLKWDHSSITLKAMRIHALAFLFCIPWLIYTYSLTGKVFYWSTAGGSSIYWMSNPNKEELGEWMDSDFKSALGVEGAIEKYSANHKAKIDTIKQLQGAVNKDAQYKNWAIQNIKTKPQKYALNVFSNVGRFFFNYPFAYYPQQPSTLINMFTNAFFFALFFLLIIPSLLTHRKHIPSFIRFMLFFLLIYLGGSFLLASYIRMFYVISPIFIVWLTFMFSKVVKLAPVKMLENNESIS